MLKIHMKQIFFINYQFLINKQKSAALNHFNDSADFIEFSNDMDDVYKSIEKCNPDKKRKIFFVFDDMIDDMLGNKQLSPIITELFTRSRKQKISLVFITQSSFAVLENIKQNSTYITISVFYDENSKQIRNAVNCI